MVDSIYSNIGRLEILFGGIWGRICYVYQVKAANKAAQVACRQMGYTSGMALWAAHYFEQSNSSFWLEEFPCTGSENHLGECSPNTFGMTTYGYTTCNNHDIAVACFDGE